MVTKAVYPGTFDPITNGHISILERAACLADELVVAVAETARKSPFFDLSDRVEMARKALAHLEQVSVKACNGLLVDFVVEEKANVIVRGLRAVSDFDYEFQLAGMNHRMAPHIDTIFLPALGEQVYTSSTMVREIVRLGGDPSAFVPEVVTEFLKR